MVATLGKNRAARVKVDSLEDRVAALEALVALLRQELDALKGGTVR